MKSVYRSVARVLVVSMFCFGLPVPVAHAELVATDEADTVQPLRASARERIATLLARDDVRAGLERHGVSASDAKARVDALSDDEIERVAARLDALPAGGDAISAALLVGFLAFVILLVTDILGFTKVFSFTRTAK
jgi:hypothetical protein